MEKPDEEKLRILNEMEELFRSFTHAKDQYDALICMITSAACNLCRESQEIHSEVLGMFTMKEIRDEFIEMLVADAKNLADASWERYMQNKEKEK